LPGELDAVDVTAARACQEAIRDAIREGELASAHDVAEGGFLVAVAEACLAGGLGAALDLGPAPDGDLERILFGESPGRGFVVSGSQDALRRLARHVDLDVFGTVGGDALDMVCGDVRVTASIDELREAHAALAPLFP
jgi:phosphoribosylformylglycinamidine synthase